MTATCCDSPTTNFRIVRPRLALPIVRGVIDRRMLVNFRCDPVVLEGLVPAPFRVKRVGGWGMAGICLIRLEQLRPHGWPNLIGLSSENAAHRIAVEWEDGGELREGVYIPRRDTNSRLNVVAGGRLFPGVHHFARFEALETPHRFKIDMVADDRVMRVRVAARSTDAWPADSVFRTIEEASAFFAAGSVGWSATAMPESFDGLELVTHQWRVEALAVEYIASSFFHDPSHFPAGSVEFDNALLMRNVPHEWHSRGKLICLPEG